MIDNHEMQLKAVELFLQGRGEEANRVQDEFLQTVLKSGEDHCSCTVACKHHGKCIECVILHRGHGHHLPNCFHNMVNERLEAVSQLAEHGFKRR